MFQGLVGLFFLVGSYVLGADDQRRVATYYLHEQMLANYRALYDETARAFNLPKKGGVADGRNRI